MSTIEFISRFFTWIGCLLACRTAVYILLKERIKDIFRILCVSDLLFLHHRGCDDKNHSDNGNPIKDQPGQART